MSSFSLTLRLLLLCIVCAPGAAEESSGVAEPECQCLHAYAAGSPDSVHVHVFVHNAHVQEETIVNLSGLDEITADNGVNDTKIRCSCNLTYTADWDRLAPEPTQGLLQQVLLRAYRQAQKKGDSIYIFVMAGSPDSVHVHVFMHNAPVQEETIVNLAGLDEITADNVVNDTEIRYMCNVVYTAAGDSLATVSTVGLLKELLRHAKTHLQDSTQRTCNIVVTLLEWTHFLVMDVLPQLLAFLLNLCARLSIVYSVMKHRETAREYQEENLRA